MGRLVRVARRHPGGRRGGRVLGRVHGSAGTRGNAGFPGREERGCPEPGPDVVALAYGYDIDDERFVVALSDNVFAGRVERVSGDEPAPTTIPGEDRPQTQYAVRVLAVVKSSGAEPLA